VKMLLVLIAVVCLVTLGLAWSAQRAAVARVTQNCLDTGIDRADCACHARAFRERTTLLSYAGAGDFRPFAMSRREENEAMIKAGALCLGERMLK